MQMMDTCVTLIILQVFTRSICELVRNRDQHWNGLGMDCIRTIPNFVEFGLDPDC